MRRVMSRPVAAAVTAVTLSAAAGCGGSGSGNGSDPRGVLVTAVQHLASADTMTSTISLEASPQILQAAASVAGTSLSAADAATIASAHIVVEVRHSSGHATFSLTGTASGKTLVELRSVGGKLYARGDIPGILTLAHQQKVIANLRAEVSTMSAFVKAFFDGKWVSLDAGALSSFTGQGGGSSSGGLLNAIGNIFKKDVTVTDAGNDSNGRHLHVVGNSRALVTDIGLAVGQSVPGGAVLGTKLDPSKVPNRSVALDAWVRGDTLTKLSINLAQFAPAGKVPPGATLPLSAVFTESGPSITAPSGAVPVDLTQLGTLLGSIFSASSSSSSGTSMTVHARRPAKASPSPSGG